MRGSGRRFVYILRSDIDPSRHYVGVTSDCDKRLRLHNHGSSGDTVAHRPWSIVVSIEFQTEREALRFELYRKSGSGRAFAIRHSCGAECFVQRAGGWPATASGRTAPPRHVPRPMLRLLAAVLGPVQPNRARQIRAAIAMDRIDLTFAPTDLHRRFPDLPVTSLADILTHRQIEGAILTARVDDATRLRGT